MVWAHASAVAIGHLAELGAPDLAGDDVGYPAVECGQRAAINRADGKAALGTGAARALGAIKTAAAPAGGSAPGG